jgi:hypothetical protein
MPRVVAAWMAIAVALTLVSCDAVLMERPLSDAKTSVYDARLLGEWIPATESNRDEQDTYFFGRNDDAKNTLDLIWVAKRNERVLSAPFQAYVTVAKKRYISLVYRGKEDNSREAKLAIAYKYEMPDDETLWLWPIDRNYMKAAIERRELHGIVGTGGEAVAIDDELDRRLRAVSGGVAQGRASRAPIVAPRPWEQPGISNVVLTDASSTILAFLERNDAACFHDGALTVYTRVPRLSLLRPRH